jgi:Protein of unknown function (DUF4197)
MKKIIATFSLLLLLTSCDVIKNMGLPLTELDVANGIKEALIQGVNKGGSSLFNLQANGNSGLLNELLPAEVGQALNVAKSLGLSPKINQLSNTLNQAAINSAQKAIPVFINGIRGMNITDAFNILRGGTNAGTAFLRNTTNNALQAAIQPEVAGVFRELGIKPKLLQNLGGSNPLLSSLDVDMTSLLSNMVCSKMYDKIGQEEAIIRRDVGARSSILLQKVFAAQ